jgi:TolA-binding protein
MSIRRNTMWGSGVFIAILLSGCGTTPSTSRDHVSDRPQDESGVVKSLQKQIRERDKRIEELESQLNALKLIDQDLEERRKSSRPPATLMPIK